MSHFDFDAYVAAREQFTTEEWIDTLIQSIGFKPEVFDRRNKLLQLVRLIPFCERNYNVIELGPKGTGKSHIYSEFSPHGMLISGGEVTVPKLFVNNATGKLGLVGYWDCVAFDEFAGKKKRVDKALVDIMKNYMANKSFSRGIETLGAEASMAFVGNTQHTVPHMLRTSDLFDPLPEMYHDSAFLDRIHFYLPGWEIDIIRGEMFTAGFGFVVDYLAEVLRSQRNYDYSQLYAPTFSLSEDISTRDRDAIHKTFSGLMKILYPHRKATNEELEEILCFAIEGRKRVKDQLMRIDAAYADVNFSYCAGDGAEKPVHTREELEHPELYNQRSKPAEPSKEMVDGDATVPTNDRASIEPSVQHPLETFQGYELMQRFESAGMAEAFEARNENTSETVFVKRVRNASTDKEALEREIRIYEKLSHLSPQHVLQVLDVVRDDEYTGFVTEFAEGGDLEDHVRQFDGGNGLTVADSREIALSILAGLHELHEGDIVHRDLKPRNILQRDGEWKLADFGISKNQGRLVTQKTFQQRGTLGYAAPEQFQGVEAKPSADVYSLGKVLVFLLSGQTDVDYITYSAWRDLIGRCLSLDPTERPALQEVKQKLGNLHV